MNRISILAIIFVTVIFAAASAQVDTLQLVEIGSIQAPSEITELYVEDLDGDSLKEIILCTDSYVYIYDSQTYQVQWTSPPLNHPIDLLFEDINRDGFIDFSVKDSTNIYLFEPHTPQTIWTSPPLDSTYRCYTIGDRNDDNWVDVAIVNQEPFTRPDDPNNLDTSWVMIFSGPLFSQKVVITILLSNFSEEASYYYHRYSEVAARIEFFELGEIGTEESKITICTDILDFYDSYVIGESSSYFGRLLMLDGINVDSMVAYSTNQVDKLNLIELDNELVLHVIALWDYVDYDNSESSYYIGVIDLDSLISLHTLWHGSTWRWRNYNFYTAAGSNVNSRFFYGTNDSLHALNFDGSQFLWEIGGITQPFEIMSVYNDNTIFSSPQIICGIGYQFTHYELYDGSDGSLSAIMPIFGGEISMVNDLDNDGIDAILSIQGSDLKIYLDETATDIKENAPILPALQYLSNFPNPFNSQTTIEYGLPEAGRVRIDIYDLLGRKVETLIDEEKQAGRHQAVWDASGYSSGVYFYRIEAGEFVDTKQMVYLK